MFYVATTLFITVSVYSSPRTLTAESGDLPYVVALLSRGSTCSGALLDARWVLTAAHCVYRFRDSPSEIKVVSSSGLLNTSSTVGLVSVCDLVLVHPAYRDVWADHDIALVKLQEQLTPSPHVDSVSLSAHSWGDTTRVCDVSGYGVVQKGVFNSLDHHLKTHRMNITRPCPCERQLIKEKGVERVRGWLCSALEQHSGPCKGDSGGPLVCGGLLWGLTSATFYVHDPSTCDLSRDPEQSFCGTLHVLNIFMDIHPYSSWLNNVTTSTSPMTSAPYVGQIILVCSLMLIYL